jgi:hypothetical protein
LGLHPWQPSVLGCFLSASSLIHCGRYDLLVVGVFDLFVLGTVVGHFASLIDMEDLLAVGRAVLVQRALRWSSSMSKPHLSFGSSPLA